MHCIETVKTEISEGKYDEAFASLYPHIGSGGNARDRYLSLLETFEASFGNRSDVRLFSSPGRVEIGGNHTDHQNGVVLAAAVSADISCVAARSCDDVVRIHSKGYPEIVISIGDTYIDASNDLPGDNSRYTSAQAEGKGSSAAMVRGIADWYRARGFYAGGFQAVMMSDIPIGSGLSSSAAFEIAICQILNSLYNENMVSAIEMAMAGRYAENEYLGKPSGLMDQLASSVGGLISIDLKDPDNPAIRCVNDALADAGYRICVTDTGGSHVTLTHEYAAINDEMRRVAQACGKDVLRNVDELDFYERISELRISCGDRAVLRAIHFFTDSCLAAMEAEALNAGDVHKFLDLVIRSGRSSIACLQNIFPSSNHRDQGLSIALSISENILEKKGGAWRVHGGGFAGTIIAFVPSDVLEEYKSAMDSVFGEYSCRTLSIRSIGGTEVTHRCEKESRPANKS
jgi:galactokinase